MFPTSSRAFSAGSSVTVTVPSATAIACPCAANHPHAIGYASSAHHHPAPTTPATGPTSTPAGTANWRANRPPRAFKVRASIFIADGDLRDSSSNSSVSTLICAASLRIFALSRRFATAAFSRRISARASVTISSYRSGSWT